MSAERTQAIVLRRTNFGEADRILTLLTPLGQRGAMARGVRREKSKLAGGIELFGALVKRLEAQGYLHRVGDQHSDVVVLNRLTSLG